MDSILQQITDWLKEMLVEAIMGNLSGIVNMVTVKSSLRSIVKPLHFTRQQKKPLTIWRVVKFHPEKLWMKNFIVCLQRKSKPTQSTEK